MSDVESPVSTEYPCCANEMENRDTFGIVLYPAESPGKYRRVGVFVSEARRGGGMALFHKTEYKEFEIV
jgi:hypothetical protein